jgi:hypothetical protein
MVQYGCKRLVDEVVATQLALVYTGIVYCGHLANKKSEKREEERSKTCHTVLEFVERGKGATSERAFSDIRP